MNNEVDEQTERLIVRHLDGELTGSEQDELNQILLRSAAARRMLSEYQENDRLAADVVGAVADGRWSAEVEPDPSARRRRVTRWRAWTAGLAAAAAIAIVVSWPQQPDSLDRVPTPPVARPDRVAVPTDNLVFTGTELPHRGERRINRDYLGVFDESGQSLLLLEVDRTRTVRIPLAGDL